MSRPLKPRANWRTLALKKWGRSAVWIDGRGPFAVLAHCRVLSVTLHPTREAAERSKAFIDEMGCGGQCWKKHEIVELKP